MKEIRHAPCSGTGKRISRERSLEAFESHRAKVREGAFAIIQKEKGLVLRDGDWVSPAEAAERDRLAQEEQRLAEEEEKREEKFAEYQRSRGLVLVDDKWMTQGSRRDIVLTVLQKLQVEGITMRRDPMSGEHGGLLCLDATDDVGCIIVSNREWHNAEEGSTYRFDLYRCGLYSYTTKSGERNTVRLYATDLDTALQEIKDRRFSKRF